MRKLFFYFLVVVFITINYDSNIQGAYGRKIQFNFNDVEIVNIIKFIGKATGSSFIFDSVRLKGKRVTFLSNRKFTASESHRILKAILKIHRLSMITEGKVIKIVASNEARGSSAPLNSKRSQTGSYVTRVIPVKHINPRTVLSSLNRLVSKSAILVSNDDANILIIRDVKENAQRFAEIVEIIDQPPKELKLIDLEIIELEHADAAETAGLVDRIFASALDAGNKSARRRGVKIKCFADKRTNSLVVVADKLVLPKIKAVANQLDKKVETDEGNIRVYPLKNANSKKVAEALQKIAQTIKHPGKRGARGGTPTKITIISDAPSNSLVIYADPEDFATLENVIEQLDKRRAQVFIQALILEVTLSKSLDFGVKWQSGAVKKYDSGKKRGLVSLGTPGETPMVSKSGTPPTIPSNTVLGVLGDTISYAGNNYFSFHAFVQALQKDSEINILGNPQILTLDNEEAQIKVGQTVPTSSGVRYDNYNNATYNFDYKDVGTELKITPQINFNDSIELQIYHNTSNLLSEKAIGEQTAITTLNRTLKTTVIVEDGQTVVLGGLIEDQTNKSESKTPCLGDIPFLGWFFKSSGNQSSKTNLMVFLTPKVVRNKKELADLTDKVKLKLKRSRKGNFRIDISKELNILSGDDNSKENDLKDAAPDVKKSNPNSLPKP